MVAIPRQAWGCLLPTLLLALTAGQPFISVTGPSQRKTPGQLVSFNCTAGPFSSGNFSVTWMKDRDEHPASAQHMVTDDQGNHSITTLVWVTLARPDVLSEITCEVSHELLAEPLRKTMNLSQVLRVVPTLQITTHFDGHQRVNLTCHVRHFYPARLHLTWMENRHKVQTVEAPQATRNPDGTFSLECTLQTEASREGNEFACWVVQDEQPPVQANITLQAHHFGKKGIEIRSYTLQGPLHRSEPGTSIQLTFTSSEFPSHHVNVMWLKNNHSLLNSQTSSHRSGSTYNVTSSVLVPLQVEDISSLVLCLIKYNSTTVFEKTVFLDQYLRVPPTVTVAQSSSSLDSVDVACYVQNFYPQSVHLAWLENCHVFKTVEQPRTIQNNDRTYTLENQQPVNVSGQRSERVITCKVQQEAQPPIVASLILSPEVKDIDDQPSEKPGLEMLALLFVMSLLGFKVLLLLSFTVAYIQKCWKL